MTNNIQGQLRALERQLELLEARDEDEALSRRRAIQHIDYEIKLLRSLLKQEGYDTMGREVQEMRE